METWELWYPKAGAAGIFFSRSRIDSTGAVLAHSLPEVLTVIVRREDGSVRAQGDDLPSTGESPMARLVIEGSAVRREEIWPVAEDAGQVVLLPGGEAGVLLSWWNAPDQSEWRWQVEFSNRKG